MLNQKIYYSIKYAMIGDIIGFGNGKVEFNFFDKSLNLNDIYTFTLTHVFNFIKDGGFSNFDFSIHKPSLDLFFVFERLIKIFIFILDILTLSFLLDFNKECE